MAELEKQGSALAGVTLEGNDFASLLKKEFKPKTEEAKSAVEQAIQTLAQQALANTQAISGAWAAPPPHQHRDRRAAQDPRAQRLQAGPGKDAEALQGRGLGPVAAVQEA